MDRITLSGVTAVGHHGVFDFERREGQPFVVDAVLHLDFAPAAASDDVRDTAHYGEVAERITDWITGEPLNLIEALAVRIAEDLLSRVPAPGRGHHRAQAPGAHRGSLRRCVRQRVPGAEMTTGYSKAVLALGSNLGERNDTLSGAVADLVDPPEVRLLAVSPVVQTKAVGGPAGQPDFLNMVITVETTLTPAELLRALPGRGEQAPPRPGGALGAADARRRHHHLRRPHQ